MEGPKNAFVKYLELLAKVDAFTDKVREAYPREIACEPGCEECCGNTFTVFAIEAHNLRLGFEKLPPFQKRLVREKCRDLTAKAPCPLLHKGLCLLYPFRPIICRTHGFPFTSSHIRLGGQSVTSFCDKNFIGRPDLSGLSSGHILNLDLLNSTLAAINHLFTREAGGSIPLEERVWLPAIFRVGDH